MPSDQITFHGPVPVSAAAIAVVPPLQMDALPLTTEVGRALTVTSALPWTGQSYTMDVITQAPTFSAPLANAFTSSPVGVGFALRDFASVESELHFLVAQRVIFAQRVALPILRHEDAAQIRMFIESDA